MSQAVFLSAVQSGDEQAVRRLIEQGGIDVNAPDGSGYCRTPIFQAKKSCIIQSLIANGAQVNLQDGNGWTPLHLTIWIERREGGRVACCERLLSNNADIMTITQLGNMPLTWQLVVQSSNLLIL